LTAPAVQGLGRRAPRWRRSIGWLLFAVGAGFACGSNLTEAELDCEDAMAHLGNCCLGFDPQRFQCADEPNGCRPGVGVSPAFDLATSECIRGESCSELVQSGVCTRAQAFESDDAGSSTEPVCP
jgi:hypothetical protein